MEKEKTQTIKIDSLESLNLYFKNKVKSTFWDLILGTVSQKHLLKRKFSDAIQNWKDELFVNKLNKLTKLTCHKGFNKKNQNIRFLLIDTLTYLLLTHILNKNLDSANDTLNLILKQIEPADKQSKDIFINRIQYVLQPTFDRSNQEIKSFSAISKLILKLQPSDGFPSLNIALNLLINEFNYDEAYKILLKLNSKKDELAILLLQITKFLMDIKPSENIHDTLFDALIKAKHLIYEKKDISTKDLTAVRSIIESSIKNSPITKIPGILVSAQTIKNLLLLIESNGSSNTVDEADTENSAMPDWLRWTILRFSLLYFNNNNIYLLKENKYFQTAQLLKFLCFDEPSSIIKRREYFLQSENIVNVMLLFNLFGWSNDLSEQWINKNISSAEIETLTKTIVENGVTSSFNETTKIDVEICYEIFKARKKILNGDFEDVKVDLNNLLKKIYNSCLIIKIWWEPIIVYWLSLAHAHNGNLKDAIKGFESLSKGPKAEEANAQLTLCLVKDNKLEIAKDIVDLSISTHPSMLYAKSLLSYKLNDVEGAEKLIQVFISKYGKVNKHYYHAIIRLSALIKEIQGHPDTALEDLTPLNNQESYNDICAAIRTSRIIVKDAFVNCLNSGIFLIESSKKKELVDLLQSLIPYKEREYNLKLLYDILTEQSVNMSQLKNIQKRISGNFSWHYLLLLKSLNSEDNLASLNLIRHSTKDVTYIDILPSNYLRAIFLVLSWQLLTNSWKASENKSYLEIVELLYNFSYKKDQLPRRSDNTAIKKDIIKHLRETLVNNYDNIWKEDDYLQAIIYSCDIALTILSHDSKQNETLLGYNSQRLFIINNLIHLLNKANDSLNSETTNEIIEHCKMHYSNYQNIQMDFSLMIAYWYHKDFENFMKVVETINYADNMPIINDHLWLAKAFVWFKNEQYDLIFKSDMPDNIADLSNSDACILMAKASTRLALKAWKTNNTKEAVNHIKQAASTLKSLNQTEI